MNENKIEKESFNIKYFNAVKWSSIAELLSKLIVPITNMILARILAPEAFGIIATITMVTSFIDMISEGGFKNYLIQREIETNEELHNYANTAFSANFILSIILWGTIFIFSKPIASLVGDVDLQNVLIIASFQVFLTGFNSIQFALVRRDLQFKKIFFIRLSNLLVPFVVTIPLAYIGLSFWSIIIGNISVYLINVILLLFLGNWKPKIKFDFKLFKNMFSFSSWNLIESFSIWLTGWIDIFIIGRVLTKHELGLYKTSTAFITSLMGVVTAAIIPVMFSGLSRIKDNKEKFNNVFLKTQRLVAFIILPMGMGIFIFSELATKILLGNAWIESSAITAIWGITSAYKIVFCNLSSEVFRAKGKPKISFLAQILHFIVLVPTIIISLRFGFKTFYISRSLIRFQFVLIHLIFISYITKIKVKDILINIFPFVFSSIVMGLIVYYLKIMSTKIIIDFLIIGLGIVIYSGLILLNKKIRKEIFELYNLYIKK